MSGVGVCVHECLCVCMCVAASELLHLIDGEQE